MGDGPEAKEPRALKDTVVYFYGVFYIKEGTDKRFCGLFVLNRAIGAFMAHPWEVRQG